MTNDDLIFRHRVRLFARAQEVGVRRACRELGFHHSTFYRWKPFVERHGLEILRVSGAKSWPRIRIGRFVHG
jgi:hypothetical protein